MSTKMENHNLVIGHFKYLDDTLSVIHDLNEKGDTYEVFSPFPSHDLEHAIYEGKRKSPVRMFTLLGGITGCLGAFLMTSWMSMDWPLRVSAKPVLSYPSFVVIAYECTILLGAIFTLLSMFHFSKVPYIFPYKGFRPNFTKDTFGVVARVTEDKSESMKEYFSKNGASNVEIQYVR